MTGSPPAVAHVVEAWLGATETFIHDYIVAFRNVRPVVVARRVVDRERFPLPPGASLHVSPPDRGTLDWAAAAVRRRIGGGEPHLEGILRAERVRVVHAHFGPTACGLVETRRRTGLPLVTSFYGYDVSVRAVIDEFRESYAALFEAGDAFLVEGGAMRRRLEELGCPASRIAIQRIAIDPARYPFVERGDAGHAPIVVLQCGRMVPKKGYPHALHAFARARKTHPRLELRIVGDGPERAAIEALIAELGIGDSVTLLGQTSRDVLLDEMRRAQLYLQPSVTAPDGDTEGGAPTTLLEAQACGLPVVATRHADIPEVVRPDESALLVPEGDDAALAAAIERIAERPGTWAAMGRAGRAHVEAQHDVRRLAPELERLYARLWGARQPVHGGREENAT
jgi:colanic acid/amylovoran biosynthesis glycosyltransferase